MSENFDVPPDKRCAPLLATCLVFLLGALGLAVVLSSAGGDPVPALTIFSTTLGLIFCFGVLFRRVPTSGAASAFAWVRHRDARPAQLYAPRPRGSSQNYGTNLPPSPDEVRELKDGLNTWVPSAVPRRRESPLGQTSRS